MLAFVLTDAVVERGDLQAALEWAVDASFNACSVDGDTSTNDMVIVLASGKSGTGADAKVLFEGLLPVCKALAHEMVLDGEGAEHAVEIEVRGLENDLEARVIAETVATSMLVKTALFGKDPNWGRLLAAAGRADVAFDPRKARISIGGVVIYDRGTARGAASEAEAKKVMQAKNYGILIELGGGSGTFSYLTSDLGHGYIDVNAGYRS
jgi:glutamate N-acetyltransferase/amino-acid N-acetyltransferase